MFARITAALTLALAVGIGGAAIAKDIAKDQDYRFAFEAFFGGFKIGEGDGSLQLAGERYALAFEARSAGMLSWVMSIDQSAQSNGRLTDMPAAEFHRNHNRDGDNKNWIELAFTPETVEIVDADPHPKTEKKRSQVSQDLLKGVADPLTAVLALGFQAAKSDACEGLAPVFDGRRRYDTVLTPVSREPYTGPLGKLDALVCEFRFVRRGGYRERAKRWKGITGTVWLQKLDEGLPYLPVRVRVDTSYGTAMVHMVSAGPTF